MGNYRIVTDSTTDLTREMMEELELKVIPLCYIMDGKTYRNSPDSGMKEPAFYGKLRNGIMSTTTQVNSEEFIAEFAPILEQGEDILYIAFSSGLSGTCQSAFVAKQELEERFPGRRVEVFDSLCASMGEGLLVHYAATMKSREHPSMRC